MSGVCVHWTVVYALENINLAWQTKIYEVLLKFLTGDESVPPVGQLGPRVQNAGHTAQPLCNNSVSIQLEDDILGNIRTMAWMRHL